MQTGWGMTNTNEEKLLDKIKLFIMSSDKCEENFRRRNVSAIYLKDLANEKIICAAEEPVKRQLCNVSKRNRFQGSSYLLA